MPHHSHKYFPVSTISGRHSTETNNGGYGNGGFRGWTIFLVSSLSLVLMNSAFSITLTVIPDIARSLHDDESRTIWIVTAGNLASTCLQPAAGKLGDVFGHGLIWMIGMSMRISSMVISGLAPNLSVLIMSNIVSGIGSALDGPSGTALVVRSFPESMRPFLLSVLAAAGTSSQTVGLLAGGVITSIYGWRAIFFAPVPLLVIITIIAGILLFHGSKSSLRLHEQLDDVLDESQRENDKWEEMNDKLSTDKCGSTNLPSIEKTVLFKKPAVFEIATHIGRTQDTISTNADRNYDECGGCTEEAASGEEIDEVIDFGVPPEDSSWKGVLLRFDWLGTVLLLLVCMQLLLCLSITFESSESKMHSVTNVLKFVLPATLTDNDISATHNSLVAEAIMEPTIKQFSAMFMVCIWGLFVFGVFLLVLVEGSHSSPILHPLLLGRPVVAGGMVATLMLWTPYMGAWLLMPLFMRDYLHWSPGYAAGLLVLRPVGNAIAGPMGGALLKLCGGSGSNPGGEGPVTAALLLFAWTIQLVSYMMLCVWIAPSVSSGVTDRPVWLLQLACFIMGSGTGIAQNSLSSLIAAEAPREMLGAALGVQRMGQGMASLTVWTAVGAVIASSTDLQPYKRTTNVFLLIHCCSVFYPCWLLLRIFRRRRRSRSGIEITELSR